MTIPEASNQQTKPPLHWPSLLQLLLSILAALLLMSAAVIIALTNASQYFTQVSGSSDLTQAYMVAAGLAFMAILVLPSAWYAWKHITSPEVQPSPQPERHRIGLILTILVLVLVGGALLLGNWASQNNQIAWFVLPPLNIIVTGLPVLWLVYFVTRRLIPGKPQRSWGVFATGLVLGPFIIVVLELLLLIVMFIFALLWAMLDPSLASQLNGLVIRLQNAGTNPQALLNILSPFLLNPGIIFIIFLFIGVFVPLLEEAIKPIGVWLLARQKITPAQGFGYGVLSGAGFGLFENLGYTASGGEAWAPLASARISALLLHCFTAGLVGWALASAWNRKQYLRLGITYLVAAIIHGLWNSLAVLSEASTFPGVTSLYFPPGLQQIGTISTIGLVVLAVLVFVFYFVFNHLLQRNFAVDIPRYSRQDQAPNPPGDAAFLSSLIAPTQSTPELDATAPLPKEDIQTQSENDSPHLEAGDKSTTNTGKNT